LFDAADAVWSECDAHDFLEAFSAHPKIGGKRAAVAQAPEAHRWSEEEQAGTRNAANETMQAMAEANLEYERKFGFIFIVCATGKSSEEMLALLKERLPNERNAELRIAAEEQRRITHLRLEKLLTK
jgi:OHCU decarboxylase